MLTSLWNTSKQTLDIANQSDAPSTKRARKHGQTTRRFRLHKPRSTPAASSTQQTSLSDPIVIDANDSADSAGTDDTDTLFPLQVSSRPVPKTSRFQVPNPDLLRKALTMQKDLDSQAVQPRMSYFTP